MSNTNEKSEIPVTIPIEIPKTMKAMVAEKYGPPEILEMKEIDVPAIESHEVLVRVHASSVNTADTAARKGKLLFRLSTGLLKPSQPVPGSDVAGEIVQVGEDVDRHSLGDIVYGMTRTGSSAEYAVAHKYGVVKRPKTMSCSEAAGVPLAALTAMQYLRDQGKIQDGLSILINGASGGVGSYAIQFAKCFDTEVTAVCSEKNKNLVLDLGADYFIDYTKQDFTTLDKKYDLILDTVGKVPFRRWKNALKGEGKFLNVGNPNMNLVALYLIQFLNRYRKQQMKFMITITRASDLTYLATLIDEGKIQTIIDKKYSMKDLSKAHEYYERGHTAGKVIVNIL